VTDGRFTSRNEPAGLSGGPYRVRVTLAAEKPGDVLKGETIPSVYLHLFPGTFRIGTHFRTAGFTASVAWNKRVRATKTR
jgi:hypothetical protein